MIDLLLLLGLILKCKLFFILVLEHVLLDVLPVNAALLLFADVVIGHVAVLAGVDLPTQRAKVNDLLSVKHLLLRVHVVRFVREQRRLKLIILCQLLLVVNLELRCRLLSIYALVHPCVPIVLAYVQIKIVP